MEGLIFGILRYLLNKVGTYTPVPCESWRVDCSYFNKRCRCNPTHTDRRGLRVLSLKASILCLPHPRRETQRQLVGSGEKNGAREETSFQAQAKEPLGAFSPDPTD